MRIRITFLLLLSFTVPSYSIGQTTEQLNKVLAHYTTSPTDSLKYKAALFLIENMQDYKAPYGKAIDSYKQKIHALTPPVSTKTVKAAWQSSIMEYSPKEIIWVNDSDTISSEFLIENIEQAFLSWENAPWYSQISFEQFCRLILPYRTMNEQLTLGWRQTLQQKYGGIIEGITDIKQAFSLLSDSIIKSVRQATPLCPYSPDVLTIDKLQQANCSQRCILQTAILRSLAIPATLDMVPRWANYSTLGHTWVSLVLNNDETYTLYEKDKEAKRFNKIDASEFPVTYRPAPTDRYPFRIDSIKKVSKVYRTTFKTQSYPIEMQKVPSLNDSHIYDVSAEYGYTDSISLNIKEANNELLCLCTFSTGRNWQPIAISRAQDSLITFNNIGTDIVYVIARPHGDHIHAVSYPFLLQDSGNIRYFIPDTIQKETITLYRKYPVFSNWSNQWGNMIGGRFEGANSPDFSDAVLLDSIRTIPFGGITFSIKNNNYFRYLRYKTPSTSRTSLAELSFYTQTPIGIRKIIGTPIAYKVLPEAIKYAFDGNRETIASTKSTKYWIGIDLGENIEQSVCSIKFIPKSDTNGVEPGHLYELFYFQKNWKSLGKQVCTDDFLIYENVPKNAILLLKDWTKGKEERIFYYDTEQQIWY